MLKLLHTNNKLNSLRNALLFKIKKTVIVLVKENKHEKQAEFF